MTHDELAKHPVAVGAIVTFPAHADDGSLERGMAEVLSVKTVRREIDRQLPGGERMGSQLIYVLRGVNGYVFEYAAFGTREANVLEALAFASKGSPL